MMKIVMNQLIKYGTVKRGVLGVNIQTLAPEIAQSMGLPETTQGALVSQVVEGSAAEKAGVKAGDVITAVNGRPVKDAGSLRNAIGLLAIGEKVDLSLLRDGKPRRVTALVSERDAAAEAKAAGAGAHSGLEGADIVDGPNGVLIRSVAEGSPAAQRGLRSQRRHPGRRPHARGQCRGVPQRDRGPAGLRAADPPRQRDAGHPDPLTGARSGAATAMTLHVCVLGGSGFIGQEIVARLGAPGHKVKVLTRNPAQHRDLKVLPSLQLVRADVHDEAQPRVRVRGLSTW